MSGTPGWKVGNTITIEGDTALIHVPRKNRTVDYIMIDAEDIERVQEYTWGIVNGYGATQIHNCYCGCDRQKHQVFLHRFIMGNRDGLQVAEVPLVADGDSHLVGTLGTESYWDTVEPPVCRVPDGDPNWAYRIRSLGNAAIPQQVEKAFRVLIGLEPLYPKPKCIP